MYYFAKYWCQINRKGRVMCDIISGRVNVKQKNKVIWCNYSSIRNFSLKSIPALFHSLQRGPLTSDGTLFRDKTVVCSWWPTTFGDALGFGLNCHWTIESSLVISEGCCFFTKGFFYDKSSYCAINMVSMTTWQIRFDGNQKFKYVMKLRSIFANIDDFL